MYPAPPPRKPLKTPPTNETMRITQMEIDLIPEWGRPIFGAQSSEWVQWAMNWNARLSFS